MKMPPKFDYLISGGLVVSSSGTRQADVAVADGTILEVADTISTDLANEVIDATGRLVFPGIIDSHNHPYYYDDIETFSLAAAYGGVTTLLPFAGRPLAAPVTGVVDTVDEFIRDGQARSYLDFGLHAILTPADIPAEVLPDLFARGVSSFKIFLAFARQKRMYPDDLALELMQRLAKKGGLCMIHCENGLAIELLEEQFRRAGRVEPGDYIASRPAPLESEAVYRALALAEVANCDAYIVHVSTGESMDIIERFRQRPGPARFGETCPHYLVLEEGDQARMGGQAKISPPMRTLADRDSLWNSIERGAVDVVASDCSGQTCTAKLAGEPNIFDIASGIPGVEQFLPLVFDEGVHRRGIPIELLARVFCERPAEIFGLTSKGSLDPGKDADIVIFDPEQPWTVRASEQHGNSNYSLYDGRELRGRATFSMQRGRPILREGMVVATPGDGQYIFRHPRMESTT